MTDSFESPVKRRSFVGRVSAAVAAFAGTIAVTAPLAGQTARSGDEWHPARHAQDDWFDQVPGKHRFFFDATSPNGVGDAITFATNFYAASKGGYGLDDADNAVVICLRHYATTFAYNDSIWSKYGQVFSDRIKFTDPKTQQAPTVNVYQASGYGMQLTNRGTTFDQLIKRGTHFAVCDMATHAFAGMVAGKLGLKSDAVYEELKANALGNAHFVAAGILAVNRAQERGYALQYIG